MASFKDPKHRIAILLADLYYESEQHQRALSMYQRLENRELGTLSKNEKAYVILATFACKCWNFKDNEIAYLNSNAKYVVGTPSEERAMFGLANRLAMTSDSSNVLRAIKLYELCIQKHPDTLHHDFILYNIGELFIKLAKMSHANNRPDLFRQYLNQVVSLYQSLLKNDQAKPYHSLMKNSIKQINLLLSQVR